MLFSSCALPAGRANVPVASRLSSLAVASRWALAMAAFGIDAVHAQSDATQYAQLDPVIVTATRTARPIDSVLPSATAISNLDVQKNLSSDLSTLLQQQAGVEFARNGGLGQQTSLFMRGGNSSHTLVLVDGLPVNTLSSMLPSINFIPTAQIDHIEVVRGNVSSLYGSNAMGGVVQIFTRRGEDGFHPFASVTAGENNMSDATIGAQGGEGRLHYSFAASNLRTDGINALNQQVYPGTNPDRDAYRNQSASGRVQWQTLPGHEFELSYSNAHGSAQFDNTFGGTATEHDVNRFSVEQTSLVSHDRFAEAWNSTLTLSNTIDSNFATMGSYNYFYRTSANHIEWQNDLRVAAQQTLTLAVGHLEQRLDSDTAFDQTRRNLTSERIGYEGAYGPLQVQANVRHDRFSDFGDATTGFLGAGWTLGAGWKLIATTSTGFSAPSFNDLYYPYGMGNPDLQPEKARSGEGGVQWQAGAWHVRSVWFKTRYSNLIVPDAATYTPYNVGSATIKGWETTFRGAWDRLQVQGMFTLQDPTDDETGERLLRRARQLAAISASVPLAGLDWSVGARGAGNRVDSRSGQTVSLGGYGVVDFSISREVAKGWTLRARLDNLTDKRYETIYGYNQPGRTFYVSLGWQAQ